MVQNLYGLALFNSVIKYHNSVSIPEKVKDNNYLHVVLSHKQTII